MGASQSKHENEQVFYNSVPIQVSSELATQLSDTSLSPDVSPARHALLDQAVRAKIGAEAARLRGQAADDDDDIVRREIELALERENLDRERGMVGGAAAAADGGADDGDGGGGGGGGGGAKTSTVVLLGDLEEVRQKVDRYRARARLTEHPGVQTAREAIASCYRANPSTTLNCWSEVAAFRTAVAKLEQQYVESLR